MIFGNKTAKVLLFGILTLAIILRIAFISSNPPSLNWDEVSHGYNAYSILKTGRGEWGEMLPTIFRAYGDYKLPVYIYTTVPSIAVFGLNEFSVRLPSVIAGVLTVLFTYLLVLELFPKSKRNKQYTKYHSLAALAALLVAVEPWSLFLSRAAFEANLAVMFITAGIFLFIKGLRILSSNYLLLSTILFGLSVWTYNSARIFVPIFLLILLYLFRKQIFRISGKNIKVSLVTLLLFVVMFLPMFNQLAKPVGQARYGKVALIDEGAVGEIIAARNSSQLSEGLTRLIYNRPVYFVKEFFNNWVQHYSGNFLFFKGGDNYQFNIPNRGILYSTNLVFLVLGVIFLLKRRNKAALILLTWFYLAPIASSLTREAPHVLRSSVMIPAPMIISAFGFLVFVEKIVGKFKSKKIILTKSLILLYLVLLFLSLGCYLRTYFQEYRQAYSWSWQYGYKEAVNYANEVYSDYDRIIMTKKYGEPHEFILFYSKWHPDDYRNDPNLIRFNQSSWYWVDGFDKFYFVNDWDIPTEEWQPFVLESGNIVSCEDLKCLLITSPGNVPKKWKKLETVNFFDGKPAFEIYEN